MPADHISTICTRPLGRIDNIVLKRIDPEPRCAERQLFIGAGYEHEIQRLRESC